MQNNNICINILRSYWKPVDIINLDKSTVVIIKILQYVLEFLNFLIFNQNIVLEIFGKVKIMKA